MGRESSLAVPGLQFPARVRLACAPSPGASRVQVVREDSCLVSAPPHREPGPRERAELHPPVLGTIGVL